MYQVLNISCVRKRLCGGMTDGARCPEWWYVGVDCFVIHGTPLFIAALDVPTFFWQGFFFYLSDCDFPMFCFPVSYIRSRLYT